jgi:hypothetical protein
MWRMLLVVIRCSSFSVLRRIVYMNGKWFVVFLASVSSLGYVLYTCISGHSVTIQRDKWRLSGTSNVCMYVPNIDTILLLWQQGRQCMCMHNVTAWRVPIFHLLPARISHTTSFKYLSERNKKRILICCHGNATMNSVYIFQLKYVAL